MREDGDKMMLRETIENVLGLAIAGAGVWVAVTVNPITTQVLILVVVLVFIGGFFISKSLMVEAVKGVTKIIPSIRGGGREGDDGE